MKNFFNGRMHQMHKQCTRLHSRRQIPRGIERLAEQFNSEGWGPLFQKMGDFSLPTGPLREVTPALTHQGGALYAEMQESGNGESRFD